MGYEHSEGLSVRDKRSRRIDSSEIILQMQNDAAGRCGYNDMISRQDTYYATKIILIDLLREIVYFPIWWYSAGLVLALKFYGKSLNTGANRLALKILFKYWFKPMYGQIDWQGKIISFFMRTVHLIWNLFLMLVWLVAMTAVFVVYIILPPLVVYQLFIK